MMCATCFLSDFLADLIFLIYVGLQVTCTLEWWQMLGTSVIFLLSVLPIATSRLWFQPREHDMWQCSHQRDDCFCFNQSLSNAQHEEDKLAINHFFCDICESRRNYVEIGALDGIKYSSTLGLERQANFGGLLIEGHPVNARALQRNRGKSGKNVIAPTAVCAQARGTVRFIGPPNLGTAGLESNMNQKYLANWGRLGRWKGRNYTVPCKPIGSMIKDAGLNLIHYFVLEYADPILILCIRPIALTRVTNRLCSQR